MPEVTIQQRAAEFVAHYPGHGLEAARVEAAWEKYPEAALVDTGIKVERVSQINRELGRYGVAPEKFVKAAACNPVVVQRPKDIFLHQYKEVGQTLAGLGLPPDAYLDLIVRQPELASMQTIRLVQPIEYFAREMGRNNISLDELGRALVSVPSLLPVLTALDEPGLVRLRGQLAPDRAAGGVPSVKADVARERWQCFMRDPVGAVNEYLPGHNLSLPASQPAEAQTKPGAAPAVSFLGVTTQFARFLKPYGITHEALAEASSPIPHTFTVRGLHAHVREMTRYFEQEGLKGNDYLPALFKNDLAAALNVIATPPGQAKAHFSYLAEASGASRREILHLLLNQPAVAADPDKAVAALKGEQPRVVRPNPGGTDMVR